MNSQSKNKKKKESLESKFRNQGVNSVSKGLSNYKPPSLIQHGSFLLGMFQDAEGNLRGTSGVMSLLEEVQ